MVIRKAHLNDVILIHKLINQYAGEGKMLKRSINELYENLRDFFIAEADGRILGCCALHITWEDLAEIRSLAVREDSTRLGIGRELLKTCIKEGKELGVKRIFTLTYEPEFFKTHGFVIIDKSNLPKKIWSDCVKCPEFPDCKEISLIYEIKDESV
ncbi:MAG: N-acetyltransferase [bacterium]|nr:N-acetyltransferase [bacterium]